MLVSIQIYMASPRSGLALGLVLSASVALIAMWVLLVRSQPALGPLELARGMNLRPPLQPQVVQFSCWAIDVPLSNQVRVIRRNNWTVAIAVEPACMPEGDFILSVPATRKELLRLTQRPEARFLLDSSGVVTAVRITRTSGSPELDAKVVELIGRRRFSAHYCGECKVDTAVNVEFSNR